MKTFITSGTGSGQTLSDVQNEKMPVYDTVADAEADLSNLSAGQLVAIPSSNDVTYNDIVDYVNAYLDTAFTRSQNDSGWVNISSSLSTQSGFSDLSGYARRKDNVIELKFSYQSSNPGTTSTTTVATGIPSKYRPTGRSVIQSVYQHSAGNNSAICTTRSEVTEDGKLQECERWVLAGYSGYTYRCSVYFIFFV